MTTDPKDVLGLADALMGALGYRRVVDPIPTGEAVELDPEAVELMDEMAEYSNYGGSSSED